MVKVKICGLRRMEDIEYVNEFLPDYGGFVFAKSKRQIDVYSAKKLMENLNPHTKKVGIFVDENIDIVKRTAETLKLDVLQFHGSESPEYVNSFKGFTIWKAAGIKSHGDVLDLNKNFYVHALVLDSVGGGTGRSFDWQMLDGIKFSKPIVLAGGLNPSNVGCAVEKVKPFCVDVSSGVETDGVKDYMKIKNFIEKVRS